MSVKRENVIYFLYITFFVIGISLFWIVVSPRPHTAIFLPFVACFGGFSGFAFAHFHLLGASYLAKFQWYRRKLSGDWHFYRHTGKSSLFGNVWTRESIISPKYKWEKSEYYSITTGNRPTK
jgi:hypothetical protein